MRLKNLYTITILCSLLTYSSFAQTSCETPLIPPVLTLVSVEPETGKTEFNWTLSPDADIAAYLIYSYRNDQGSRGDPIDTLWNPAATSYSFNNQASIYYSTSFVVTAYRLPRCEGPFSNVLSTIFTKAQIDSCNNKINVSWNSYSSFPKNVSGYSILVSVNNGNFKETGTVSPEENSFILNDFDTDSEYCFVVRANLYGGLVSNSNSACISTKMQRPPQWINADYATLDPGKGILLSFNIDPASEISKFSLEKKTGSSGFEEIEQFSPVSGSVLYTDDNADTSKINLYRLSAINNCNNHVSTSNIATNMILSLLRYENDVILKWNPYRKWRGINSSNKLFINTGNRYEEMYSVPSGDTVFAISYSDMMYDISSPEICFMVRAFEASNPYGINGESRSSIVCTPVTENIIVPNTFTPDNNLRNDSFRPVLSFTPVSYHLLITDLQRKTLFETSDFTNEWDGTKNGSTLPEGVYLWFLKITTPSGKNISKSGTVTIIMNR